MATRIEANSYSEGQVEEVKTDSEMAKEILENPKSIEQVNKFPEKLKELSSEELATFLEWISKEVDGAMNELSGLWINKAEDNKENKDNENETSEIHPEDEQKIQNYLFVKSKEDFLSPEAKKALHDAEEREYDKLNKSTQDAIKWETGKEEDFATTSSQYSKIES